MNASEYNHSLSLVAVTSEVITANIQSTSSLYDIRFSDAVHPIRLEDLMDPKLEDHPAFCQ